MTRLPDKRLAAVAAMVRPGVAAADIGTDHGYLACALAAEGRCPRCYACDLREGPLAAAEKTIARMGLSDRVMTILTDGLRGLPLGEIGDIVIAGMGGELIARILSEAPEAARSPDKRYVLQPMTRPEELRRALCRMGFSILQERAVVSGRFVYTVIQAAWTGEIKEADMLFAHTGLLPGQDHPAARRYLAQTASRLERQARGLLAGSKDVSGQAAELLAVADRIRLDLER